MKINPDLYIGDTENVLNDVLTHRDQCYCHLISTTSDTFDLSVARAYAGWVPDGNGEKTFRLMNDKARIIVPHNTARHLLIGGLVAGSGFAHCYISIADGNGTEVGNRQTRGSLTQGGGNGYWKVALPTNIVSIDPTKDWYISLKCSGYNNQNFYMTDGFGNNSCSLFVLKID